MKTSENKLRRGERSKKCVNNNMFFIKKCLRNIVYFLYKTQTKELGYIAKE